MITCARCGEPVNDQLHAWKEVTGWEKKRRGGGTNHVAIRKPTGRVMHDTCMMLTKIPEGQESLELGS